MRTLRTIPKEKMVNLPIDRIMNKFDVRVMLDQDRVIQFAGLYESGVILPPVRVVQIDEDTYAYVDGRTRGAARAYLNLPDVQAIVVDHGLKDDPIELYAQALQANWGGAKPPTRDDIVHTIIRMVELGATQTAITSKLSFLPQSSTRAYTQWARSTLSKRRLSKALDAITEDALSIDEAAKKFNIKPQTIKESISGKKSKNRATESQLVLDFQHYISSQLKSANSGISKKMEMLFHQVEDGEISSKSAGKVINSWYEHLRKTSLRVADWQARLESISSEQDKAVASL